LSKKIDAKLAAFDEQHFLRIFDFAAHRLMEMRIDGFATRMTHIAELLRPFVLREKRDPGFLEAMGHDHSDWLVSDKYHFVHCGGRSTSHYQAAWATIARQASTMRNNCSCRNPAPLGR
jgi:hypothetical protein